MKQQILLFILISLASITFSQQPSVTELSSGWKFAKGKNDQAYQTQFNDKNWQNVSVPHDWAIYGPFDKEVDKQVVRITQNGEKVASEKTGRTGALPYIGEGWYRNYFELPDYKPGQKVLILFEGAMSEPRVYVNGKKVGEWNYGYNYFYFDITNAIQAGAKNTLAVHLSNMGQSSRWYPGAGLYRKVSLIVKNQASIDQWGTFITTPYMSSDEAKVNVKTKVSGDNLRLQTFILDAKGDTVARSRTQDSFGKEFEQNISVSKPQLWSPETPYLYKAVTRLYQGNELKDETTTRFGIREISFKPESGEI